ncbi:Protein of unknown function [Gryllus bimaculatus]|nr:Protein of unknown function [Gryllus bimaculatus]
MKLTDVNSVKRKLQLNRLANSNKVIQFISFMDFHPWTIHVIDRAKIWKKKYAFLECQLMSIS